MNWQPVAVAFCGIVAVIVVVRRAAATFRPQGSTSCESCGSCGPSTGRLKQTPLVQLGRVPESPSGIH